MLSPSARSRLLNCVQDGFDETAFPKQSTQDQRHFVRVTLRGARAGSATVRSLTYVKAATASVVRRGWYQPVRRVSSGFQTRLSVEVLHLAYH